MSMVDSGDFSESADVVVVGFGAAGVCAAIAARENGADVLALDRANGGGSTAISGGIVYAGGGTWVQQQAGVNDSYEQMLTYLRREVGDAVSPQTLESFVAGSPEMIRWLSDYGVPFDSTVCPYKTSYPNNHYYLYHSGSENAGEFRALTPPVQRGHRVKGKGTSGKKMYEPLAKSALELGVRFSRHTRVDTLIQDADGRVVGVEATTMRHAPARILQRYTRLAAISDKPGIYYPPLRALMERQLRSLERRYARPIRIRARRGVVICAGGYMANTEWVKRYAPQYLGGLQIGTSGDDGSGIAMAQSAGAVTERMDNVSAWRFITPPSVFISAIIVDEQGRRIIDESRYGAAVGHQMVRHHHGKGWLLADAALIKEARRQMLKQPLWFQRAQSAALMFVDSDKGGSLREVAQRAGVDPDGLVATVDAHNNAIDAGATDPVGKPADFVRRIDQAPFTLLNISIRPSLLNPTPMLTLGGIRVDETTGAVLDAAGAAIPGLYSAGRTATGICSNSYVSGLSLADCVYAGRRAGKHAAADQPADR